MMDLAQKEETIIIGFSTPSTEIREFWFMLANILKTKYAVVPKNFQKLLNFNDKRQKQYLAKFLIAPTSLVV